MTRQVDVSLVELPEGRWVVQVRVGHLGTERVVPPAGEDHAFERDIWRHHVEVYASRTGRSVRLFVNGSEVELPLREEDSDERR